MGIYGPIRVKLVTTTDRAWHRFLKNEVFDVIKAKPLFWFCADTEHNRKLIPPMWHGLLKDESLYIAIDHTIPCEYKNNREAASLLLKE